MPVSAVHLSRRSLLLGTIAGVFGSSWWPRSVLAASKAADSTWDLSAEQWRQRLSPEAYDVLRNEGTERPFTSPLNAEKRNGTYHCAGCDQPLFSSEAKFDSGYRLAQLLAALAGWHRDESRFQIDHSPYGIPLQPLRWSPGPRVQ